MSKCRYNLSEDCNNTDCLNCVLDKIRAELIQSIQNGTLKIERGNEELFRIINKYNAESDPWEKWLYPNRKENEK